MSKVLEKWVSQQIRDHLNNTVFSFHPLQFGFRPNHSTDTANCFFIENIKSLLDKNSVVGAIFLDFRKAFDTVNHKILLSKRSHFNFSDKALKWVAYYLYHRSQTVRIGSYQSEPLHLFSGVPQGSILGPLLFCMYINDLPRVCPEVNIQMYTDDTVLYIHGPSKTAVATKLTNAMVKISEWLNQCSLQLNVSKTVGMFFTKTTNSTANPDIVISGEKLQIVTEFKYLGILIDSKLNFNSHITKTVKKVKFNLSNFRFIRNSMSTRAVKMFMHSVIFSHMTYCLTSWSQANHNTLKPIQSLYKQTLKVLDKKPHNFHHCNILSKYNLLNLENLIKFTNICLAWPEILSLRSNTSCLTRGTSRGDCVIPFRKRVFSQSTFSIKASKEWNNIQTPINSYNVFRSSLKRWLLNNQTCQH